jgi:hypothetical protein
VLGHVPNVDDVLLARRSDNDLLLMPHGGEAIVQALVQRLVDAGVHEVDEPKPLRATDDAETDMLGMLPLARTRLALDLVLDQPRRWRTFTDAWTNEDAARSKRLMRLLHPPLVAIAGPVNIGKSTLLNTLAGERAAVVADAPGTTRDHVGVLLDLGGLIVEWVDTPGFRDTDDPVEAAAIALAKKRVGQADLLIGATDASHDWLDLKTVVGRHADVTLALRSDLGTRDDAHLQCSSLKDTRLDTLVSAVRDALVWPSDLSSPRPWQFEPLQPDR